MSKRTPYAVLAKLAEELNEENERLSSVNEEYAKRIFNLNKEFTKQQEQLKLELGRDMVEFIGDRDDFRVKFVKIASEMAELLCSIPARKLAVTK